MARSCFDVAGSAGEDLFVRADRPLRAALRSDPEPFETRPAIRFELEESAFDR